MKTNHPETTLRNGNKPSGNGGLKNAGLKEGMDTPPAAESNVETLRHGKKPGHESVKQAAHNHATLKRARFLNDRSQSGGAEKEGGY